MRKLNHLALALGLLLVCFGALPAHASGVCSSPTSRRSTALRQDVWDTCASLIEGVGTKSGTGVTVAESGSAAVHRTILTFTGVSVTVTDTGGANGAQGSLLVYTLPEGIIVDRGCVANLTTLAGSGGIADGAALVASLGTTAAAVGNATLTTTEADWIASYAGTLTAGAGVVTKYGDPVATSFDGHTTPVPLYFNVAVPDGDVSANDTLTVNGTVTCTWSKSGDY